MFFIVDVKNFLCTDTLSTFDEVQNLSLLTFFRDFSPLMTFYDLETNFYSRFVTSDDLWLPRVYFPWKQTSRPLFRYIIYYKQTIYIQSSEFDLFRNFWPQVTLNYLETPLIRKLTSRASFSHIIYNILSKFEIWPFLEILTSSDLWWPGYHFFRKLTSRASFWYTIYPL